MPKWAYIVISVAIILILAVTFIVSFVLYRKTPVPKGCEEVQPDPNLCPSCSKEDCAWFEEYHKENSKGDNK